MVKLFKLFFVFDVGDVVFFGIDFVCDDGVCVYVVFVFVFDVVLIG